MRTEEVLEPDRVSRGHLEAVLYRLAEGTGERLRRERLLARTLQLELRYADGAEVTGRGRLAEPSSDDLRLYETARGIFARIFTRRVRVRSLAVTVAVTEPEPVQRELFVSDGARERTRRLRDTLDTLRARFPQRVAPAFGKAIA